MSFDNYYKICYYIVSQYGSIVALWCNKNSFFTAKITVFHFSCLECLFSICTLGGYAKKGTPCYGDLSAHYVPLNLMKRLVMLRSIFFVGVFFFSFIGSAFAQEYTVHLKTSEEPSRIDFSTRMKIVVQILAGNRADEYLQYRHVLDGAAEDVQRVIQSGVRFPLKMRGILKTRKVLGSTHFTVVEIEKPALNFWFDGHGLLFAIKKSSAPNALDNRISSPSISTILRSAEYLREIERRIATLLELFSKRDTMAVRSSELIQFHDGFDDLVIHFPERYTVDPSDLNLQRNDIYDEFHGIDITLGDVIVDFVIAFNSRNKKAVYWRINNVRVR